MIALETDGPNPFEAFKQAIAVAGSESALARLAGCTPGNINQLVRKRSQLPARYVLSVEMATGVSRHALRPDIYPPHEPTTPPPPATMSPTQ